MKYKKGFAFIEFDSYNTAKKVVEEYNNKNNLDFELALCWPKTKRKNIGGENAEDGEEQEKAKDDETVYTVSNIDLILILFF